MGIVRDWRAGVARAGGVALLVPAALGAAAVLTATFGGGMHLRALGQVVGGPAAAAVQAPVHRTSDLPAVPAAEPPATAAPAAPPSPSPAGGTRPPVPRAPAATPAPAPSAPAPSETPSGLGGSGSGSGSAPAPTPAPVPAPAQHGPVGQAGDEAAALAGSLPAPVGPVAADAVQSVVDLISPPGGP